MTFTKEPGIYVPNIGGRRIEKPVVVTDNGCEIFSKVEKDWLISI
jgi:Xaa-Pro aminopeptidase